MPLFRAAITRGASPINPDFIEVTDKFVIYKKRRIYLIGYVTISIPKSKVSSIELNTGVIGTDLIITCFGMGTITGHRFTLRDAKEIKRLIETKS
jgi:hypothetical protein